MLYSLGGFQGVDALEELTTTETSNDPSESMHMLELQPTETDYENDADEDIVPGGPAATETTQNIQGPENRGSESSASTNVAYAPT